ncbi:MAG: hypothetical protein JW810_03625, partial [Sedimentisphaerales bacterium]|nr:hypothetical protein [Sedimentisphaerales bacterium]
IFCRPPDQSSRCKQPAASEFQAAGMLPTILPFFYRISTKQPLPLCVFTKVKSPRNVWIGLCNWRLFSTTGKIDLSQ